ncbi:hypothetical protein ASE85_16735 [Sphingobium sp. Leaf26]|nr:hypothetical protein ASE85_16735 [Sphingobium sp. Leaf26]
MLTTADFEERAVMAWLFCRSALVMKEGAAAFGLHLGHVAGSRDIRFGRDEIMARVAVDTAVGNAI